MKIRPVEDELFCADGQTDSQTYTTKLIVAFRNFANPPKTRFVHLFCAEVTNLQIC
jgi:hypothetical protein